MKSLALNELENAYEAFEGYAETIEEIVLEKMPKLIESAERLADAAIGIKDNAAGEIEALSAFEKVTASAKLAVTVANVTKIPGTLKKALDKFKNEIFAIKDAVAELQSTDKFGQNAKKCAHDHKKGATECYHHIYGPIVPTKKD